MNSVEIWEFQGVLIWQPNDNIELTLRGAQFENLRKC